MSVENEVSEGERIGWLFEPDDFNDERDGIPICERCDGAGFVTLKRDGRKVPCFRCNR